MGPDGTPDDYVELRFGPRWTYISSVRKFLASFFLIGLSDKERAEQISMAASELLENAIKYSSEDSSQLRVEVRRVDGHIDLMVENPADPQQINVLRRELALVNAGEPEEAYLRRMEEAAKGHGQNRLGLIRIRYEAGARLRLETTERTVSIHAIFPIEEP
ncbi:MAG: hypothetical protein ACT4QD_18455 [Acidobacteriota bacterium]